MNFNLCLMVCVFRMIIGMKKLLFIYLEALWALRWLKSILAGKMVTQQLLQMVTKQGSEML